MVVRWSRRRHPGWIRSAVVNGLGAAATGVVLVIVAVTKAAEGAWIIIALVPVLVAAFVTIRRHYRHVAQQLSLEGWQPEAPEHSTVLVLVGGVHRAVLQATAYARGLSHDVRAVFVATSTTAPDKIRADWSRWGEGTALVVLPSPYRSLIRPLLYYIDSLLRARPRGYVTVILPEFVPARWWQHLLHNQQSLLIKAALLFRRRVVVTSVRFHLER
jgi:hypothetical protein